MFYLTKLARHRFLLWQWTLREVRVRYKQSVLGAAWAILQPLGLTVVFTLVFSRLVRVDTGGVPYPVFAYSALVPWTLFSTSLGYGIPSLVTNMNLVTKVYFPREVLPLASIGAALVDFSISFVLLIFLMLYYQIYPDVTLAWIPLLLIVQTMLSIGLVLFGSSIVVFFRDIRFIVPLLIQVWLYATPIIYPVTLVPERFRTVYFLNPMAGIIEGYRSVLISGRAPDVRTLSMAGIISTVTLVGGYLFFKHFEPIFADVI